MSDPAVGSMRKIVMGAAHGAWMTLLVGVVLTLVSWAAYLALVTFAPDYTNFMTHMSPDQLWTLMVRFMSAVKLMMIGWILFATFLSHWWRAL